MLETLRTRRPAIVGVVALYHITDGEFVASRFDLETPFGRIDVFDDFRGVNGFAEVRPYFDPRVIIAAQPLH